MCSRSPCSELGEPATLVDTKVRCNGETRCQQCTHLDLRCYYSPTPASTRSRKGSSRGQLIAEYKNTQGPSRTTALAPLLPARGQRPCLTAGSRGLAIGPQMLEDLMEDYTSAVYPVLPIMSRIEVEEAIDMATSSRECCAFTYAFAALTINMTRVGRSRSKETVDDVIAFSRQALELRGPVMPYDEVTVRSVMVPLFVSVCLFANHYNVDMGFFYLREAISRIEILAVDSPERMAGLNSRQISQRQRLYWVLFIHERFHTLSLYRPSVLSGLPSHPDWDVSVENGVQEGFNQIISLFRLIDSTFIENWLNKSTTSTATFSWIEEKQAQLSQDLEDCRFQALTEMQQVDLIITQYWLRTSVWQIALSKFLLKSEASTDSMSIFFPMRISHRLRHFLVRNPRKAMEPHGTGILKKIFDITNTFADILIFIFPAATQDEVVDRMDDFLFLHTYLLNMSRFYRREKEILDTKLERLRAMYPHVRATKDI